MSTPSWFNTDASLNPIERHPSGARKLTRADSAAGHEARRANERIRGRFLHDVEQAKMSVLAAIAAAKGNPVLEKIALTTLIGTQGLSIPQAHVLVRRIKSLSGTGREKKNDKTSLGWLTDIKVGTNRIIALAEVLTPRTAVPWEGFPYTPPPTDIDVCAYRWQTPYKENTP